MVPRQISLSVMLFIALHLPVFASPDHVMRGRWSVWTLESGEQWHCRPISHCGLDREVRPCLVQGEEDRCEKCPEDEINMDKTSSRDYFPCYKEPDCPEGTVKNPHSSPSSSSFPSLSCNHRCTCNPLEGWYGSDSCHCKKVDYPCGVNTYLNSDGHCTGCPWGTHKPGLGYGPCLNVAKMDLPTLTTTAETQESPSTFRIETTSNETNGSKTITERSLVNVRPVQESKKTVLTKHQDETKGHPGTQYNLILSTTVICVCTLLVCLSIGIAGLYLYRRRRLTEPNQAVCNVTFIQNIYSLFLRRRPRSSIPGVRGPSDSLTSQTHLKSVDFNPPTLHTGTGSASSLHKSTTPLLTDPEITQLKQVV